MKRCPTCNKTFTDPNLSFCIDDGTPLIAVPPEEQKTVALPQSPESGSTLPPAYGSDWKAPAYRPPPGSQFSTAPPSKRRVWPWIFGILAALLIGIIGLGVAAAIVIPRMMRAANNFNSAKSNANTDNSGNENPTVNSNSSNTAANTNANITNSNSNVNTNERDSNSPPANSDEVLAELTNLEHEWTAANINADKKALARILADDYVGTSQDGKALGKAEYIRTIQRDTQTQRWDFEDLKVNLKRDRATLTGVIRYFLRDREVAFRFTDKFVWRDGRWQAISSEISQIK